MKKISSYNSFLNSTKSEQDIFENNRKSNPQNAGSLLKSIDKSSSKSSNVYGKGSLEDLGLSSGDLSLLRKTIKSISSIVSQLNKMRTFDSTLTKLVDKIKLNPISTVNIEDYFKSDPKSLKIFVSNFVNAIYSTEFKGGLEGRGLVSKLKSTGINDSFNYIFSINEDIYSDRRSFIDNLQKLMRDLQAVYSYTKSNSARLVTGDPKIIPLNNTIQSFFEDVVNLKTQLKTLSSTPISQTGNFDVRRNTSTNLTDSSTSQKTSRFEETPPSEETPPFREASPYDTGEQPNNDDDVVIPPVDPDDETLSESPTDTPTEAPTDTPTEAPTDTPTESPTDTPTEARPNESPTKRKSLFSRIKNFFGFSKDTQPESETDQETELTREQVVEHFDNFRTIKKFKNFDI